MQWGERFAYNFINPITELVVTIHNESDIITIQGMKYIKFGIPAIIVSRELWGVYIVVKKEGVAPLLSPQLCTIHHGCQQSWPSLCLGSLYQPTVIQCGGFRHGLLQRHICVLNVTASDFPSALPQ